MANSGTDGYSRSEAGGNGGKSLEPREFAGTTLTARLPLPA